MPSLESDTDSERNTTLKELETYLTTTLSLDATQLTRVLHHGNAVVRALMKTTEAASFLKPVAVKHPQLAAAYAAVIREPMDLGAIKKRASEYQSIDELASDVSLIWRNCVVFNGPSSPFSVQARSLLDQFIKAVREYGAVLAGHQVGVAAATASGTPTRPSRRVKADDDSGARGSAKRSADSARGDNDGADNSGGGDDNDTDADGSAAARAGKRVEAAPTASSSSTRRSTGASVAPTRRPRAASSNDAANDAAATSDTASTAGDGAAQQQQQQQRPKSRSRSATSRRKTQAAGTAAAPPAASTATTTAAADDAGDDESTTVRLPFDFRLPSLPSEGRRVHVLSRRTGGISLLRIPAGSTLADLRKWLSDLRVLQEGDSLLDYHHVVPVASDEAVDSLDDGAKVVVYGAKA